MLTKLYLDELETDLGGRFPFSALSLSPWVWPASLQLLYTHSETESVISMKRNLNTSILINNKSSRKSRPSPHPCCMICKGWCWLTGHPCWRVGGTWLPVSLPQSQDCEAAVDSVAVAAAVASVSAGPVSVWSDGRHPGPTNCAVSCTQRNKTKTLQPC